MSGIEVINEEKPVESFELVVTEKSVGTLSTNIEALEKFAEERLKDYTPEKFQGDSDAAKKARAELNKAVDAIKRDRINILNEFMKPASDFETRCKKLEKTISGASSELDVIVKIKEQEEKNVKRQKIECIWNNQQFELFDIDRVFNEKWLNKTYKLTDIENEIKEIITKTYSEIKQIEKFAQQDIDVLKAFYLDCLNIGDTFDYAEQLQKNREILAKEQAERAEREHEAKISQQKTELTQETNQFEQKQELNNLAEQALASASGVEVPKPVRKEFVVTVKVFDEELMKLKAAMNELGIEYSVEELRF